MIYVSTRGHRSTPEDHKDGKAQVAPHRTNGRAASEDYIPGAWALHITRLFFARPLHFCNLHTERWKTVPSRLGLMVRARTIAERI